MFRALKKSYSCLPEELGKSLGNYRVLLNNSSLLCKCLGKKPGTGYFYSVWPDFPVILSFLVNKKKTKLRINVWLLKMSETFTEYIYFLIALN